MLGELNLQAWVGEKKRKTIAQSKTHEFRILMPLVVFQLQSKLENYALISNDEVQLIAKLACIPCPKVPGQVMQLTQGLEFNLIFAPSLSVNPRIGTLGKTLGRERDLRSGSFHPTVTSAVRSLHLLRLPSNVMGGARNHFVPLQV